MLTFELLGLVRQKHLPMRSELQILLAICLTEKIDATREAITSNPAISPDHHLFTSIETILNFLNQLMIAMPDIFTILFLNYDVQLFGISIIGNLFKSLTKLAECAQISTEGDNSLYFMILMTCLEICKNLMRTKIIEVYNGINFI